MTEPEQTPELKCALCYSPVTVEHYCYGCAHYICDQCDRSPPMGRHGKEDHLYDQHGKRRPA